jgi:hypothetical protein
MTSKSFPGAPLCGAPYWSIAAAFAARPWQDNDAGHFVVNQIILNETILECLSPADWAGISNRRVDTRALGMEDDVEHS